MPFNDVNTIRQYVVRFFFCVALSRMDVLPLRKIRALQFMKEIDNHSGSTL